MSVRSNAPPRVSSYCYPNLLASAQPAIVARYGPAFLENGFANRFLIGNLPSANWDPNCGDISAEIAAARAALDIFAGKAGVVQIPQGYLHDFQDRLFTLKAPHSGYWHRLKNEYGPRLAVILSVRAGDDSSKIVLPEDIWEKVETLLYWLYGQAVSLFDGLLIDEKAATLERNLDRLCSCIQRHGAIQRSLISRLAGRGTNAKQREALLAELVERGEITATPNGFIYNKGASA